MGQTAGSKNKIKKGEPEMYFQGYILMDSGFRIKIDVSSLEIDVDKFIEMAENCYFPYEEDECIWTGDILIRAKKVIGWELTKQETDFM